MTCRSLRRLRTGGAAESGEPDQDRERTASLPDEERETETPGKDHQVRGPLAEP